MEPSTAFSIAKFAYSTYEYLNSKEDTQQFEVITKLLNQINTKLDFSLDNNLITSSVKAVQPILL